MKVNDPHQPFDHEGNPEDGPERFIEIEVDPNQVSVELEAWLARRRQERDAKKELAHYEANPPHRPKHDCPRCGYRYYEVGTSNGYCAVCVVELQHRAQFQVQVEDIHP